MGGAPREAREERRAGGGPANDAGVILDVLHEHSITIVLQIRDAGIAQKA